MTRKIWGNKKAYMITALLSLILCAAASVSKLFIGFDIDEGYAIAMPYRVLSGDRLFADMWEIHQTSSFLPALLMWPYLKITGTTEGIVICLRAISLIIHIVMTFFVWRMTAKLLSGFSGKDSGLYAKTGALLAALVYFNLLPKWMQSVDFSMQQMWGLTLVILLIYMEEEKKPAFSFLTGIALSLTVLGYVGMIVLYPVAAVLYFLRYEDKKRALLSFIYMTLGCAFMAAGFFIYCLPVSKVSLSEFLSEIPNVFSDGTHSLMFADKLVLYARQWSVVLKHGVIFLAAALICMGFVRIILKKREDLSFFCRLACFVMLISSLLMVAAPVAGIKLGPFHFQSRLLVIYILMWADMLFGKKEKGIKMLLQSRAGFMLFSVMLLSAVSFAGVLIFSNVGPDSSSSYLTHGLAAGLLMMYHKVSCRGDVPDGNEKNNAQKEPPKFIERAVFTLAAAAFILSLLMCRGFYVRYTEYFPSDITQKREAVSQGPLAGVYLLPEDALTEYDSRSMIENATKNLSGSDAKAMLLGTDQIHDLEMGCRIVCPSTISTPAFNEQWVSYFEKKPELLPDIVFISKNTIDNREKFFEKNVFGQYLAKRYDTAGMQENDAMCMILRKADK